MPAKIYTLGHSNHTLDRFIELLDAHEIEVVVDARSNPFARYSKHFDHDALKSELPKRGKKYLFLGRELGGKPASDEYYDEDNHVLYWKLALSTSFKQGIKILVDQMAECRCVLVCGEEDPMGCHRRLLISRVLQERGVQVFHIRGDGSLQTEEQLQDLELPAANQMSIFDIAKPETKDEEIWRSTQSVLRRKAPPNSLKL
jgi:uncharacterized protein (DUF488 family)